MAFHFTFRGLKLIVKFVFSKNSANFYALLTIFLFKMPLITFGKPLSVQKILPFKTINKNGYLLIKLLTTNK